MAKIVTVMCPPSTEQAAMENAAATYNLAIGPFGEDNEIELVCFLQTAMNTIRPHLFTGANGFPKQTPGRSLSLYLKPTHPGWLLEAINRYDYLGLNPGYVEGLILDASLYQGSLNDLWNETASFGGPKYFWHDSSSGWFTTQLRQISVRQDCAGIYLKTQGSTTSEKYNTAVGLLAEARIGQVRTPVWTEYFPVESQRTNLVFLGSSGHHTDLDSLP